MRGLDPGRATARPRVNAPRVGITRLVAPHFLLLLLLFLLLGLGLGCSGPSETGRSPEPGPCFVLPGAMSGATPSYRPGPGGHLEPAGEARGGAAHMRAAFHPDGRTLYIASVGPEWLDSVAGRPADPGVRVRAYGFDPSSCAIGPFLGEAEASPAAPSNERAYGLVVHPGGAYLYQTTASLGRIRIYDIGPDRVPVLRTEVDATGAGTRACAQARRLAIDAAGETLYANCNNRDADAPMALQVWRAKEDGGLELLQHLAAPAMDLGVFDPVLHPAGAWLYHPLATISPDAPAGPGAYVFIYRVAADGRLQLHDRLPIRGVEPRASAVGAAVVQDYPITVTLHPDGETAYIARHVVLESEGSLAFRHGFAVYGLEDGGGTLVERRTLPATRETRYSSHHGATLVGVDDRLFYYSYLTDYDTTTGGVLQQLEIGPGRLLVPLDSPWIATGLFDGRQPIPAP